MSSVNKAVIVGYLGKDPELRKTNGGTSVASFSIATNNKYKDKEGKEVSETEWHNIVAWGKTAEICAEYLKKGSLVYVEGQLKTRSWKDEKVDVTRYSTEIHVSTVQFLGKSAGGNDRAPHPADTEEDRPL